MPDDAEKSFASREGRLFNTEMNKSTNGEKRV
jgi:hypothetical protein